MAGGQKSQDHVLISKRLTINPPSGNDRLLQAEARAQGQASESFTAAWMGRKSENPQGACSGLKGRAQDRQRGLRLRLDCEDR